jgi:hypothetical protein
MKKRILLAAVAVAAITLIIVLTVRHRKVFLYAGTVEATEVDLSSRVTGSTVAPAMGTRRVRHRPRREFRRLVVVPGIWKKG